MKQLWKRQGYIVLLFSVLICITGTNFDLSAVEAKTDALATMSVASNDIDEQGTAGLHLTYLPLLAKQKGAGIRALWADGRSSVSEIVNHAVSGGFDTILYHIGGGEVGYDSDLLPSSSYDRLARIVQEAHAHGLRVQAWWAVGVAPRSSAFRSRYPGWSIADVYGIADNYHWLNFSLPQVQSFVADVVVEIATRYNVDGVHLDYIRFPPPPPYGPIDCADFFSPNDVPNTVRLAYQRLKAVKPGVVLTAAVMKGQGGSANHLQNWADWLKGGYIDNVMPMAYFGVDERDLLQKYIEEWKRLPGSENIVPGLVVYSQETSDGRPKTPQQLLAELTLTKKNGFPGFALFNELNISDELVNALPSFSP